MRLTDRHSIKDVDFVDLLKRSAFALSFFVCFMLLCTHVRLLGGPSTIRVSQDDEINDGWTTPAGTPANLYDLAATQGWAKETIAVSRRLPDSIENGIELNFLSANCTLKLYYDDELVYTFEPDPTEYGSSWAPHFNFAPLDEADANKLATIEVTRAHSDAPVKLLDIRLSGTSTYIQRFVRKHSLDVIISLIVIFVGLIVIVLHFSMASYARNEMDLLALGAICVLLGTWSSAETLVVQLVTGLGMQVRVLGYLSLLFLPYPMCRFMGSLVRPQHQELYERIILSASVISIASTTILGICFDVDMHQSHVISRAQLVLLAIMLAYQVRVSFEERGHRLIRGLQEANRAILVAFIIMIVSSIIDFFCYRSLQATVDTAAIMRYALFAFAIVLSIEAFKMTIAFMKRADHMDDIEAVAYMDALTGIGNRTAWVVMKNEIDEAIASGIVDDALVGTFDVNFLKRVNDNYGHAAGDNHLKRAAETINRSFGTEGACYRTGGDEFTVLLVGINLPERLTICSDLFRESVKEQNDNGEGEVEMSMAMGFAYVSESHKHSIDSANTLADKRMYEHKRAMKAERKD